MKFIETIKRAFTLQDLRKKILYTIALLLVFRFLTHVPLPFIDIQGLKSFFENNQVLGMIDLFSGGSISRFSIAMLGVGPYITASIVIQLLTVVVPSLENLQKEGEYGRQKINQYTRYLSVPFGLIESFGLVKLLQSQGVVGVLTTEQLIFTLVLATAGSVFLMWIGELISENGIGNGLSIIIALGIIAGLPSQIVATAQILDARYLIAAEIIIAAILVVIFIVLITEAERRIPVSYARRASLGRTLSPVESYLPIKPNAAGVIPIIFATSMLIMPNFLAQYLKTANSVTLQNIGSVAGSFLSNNTYYTILFFVLVFLFTFFYTSVIFQPNQMAENLQKQGGFVPGIRPGIQTAQYLSSVIYKVTFSGAIGISIVAVFPFILQSLTNIKTLAIGGTGILIIVSVVLELVRQIDAQLAMRSYDESY
ncbi:preprotein translocase subunit SecY [Candidatus Berkelbacteria bacterium CG10_big_fil_rev_8_21_14_0_10_41_12]|uniref:Protein translocase subunit SecY n=1 Tax=Candidatus Berkelbacteria bacterium CG10_big_fil_rev_8_21_14_0_10_41_12 TaxID=1974513 RepID=A0A2M6WXS4_9BACT|nr:MAG: preprotein translocase subunit SecY [Candidatus Berkelbacteria bacterium CG10_big_fil_rev_8_21_14_0_10_41_12]